MLAVFAMVQTLNCITRDGDTSHFATLSLKGSLDLCNKISCSYVSQFSSNLPPPVLYPSSPHLQSISLYR